MKKNSSLKMKKIKKKMMENLLLHTIAKLILLINFGKTSRKTLSWVLSKIMLTETV